MPYYEVTFRIDGRKHKVSVVAPCHGEAPDAAIMSLSPDKRKGVVVVGVNRSGGYPHSQQRDGHSELPL
jgi:hypothetical protein